MNKKHYIAAAIIAIVGASIIGAGSVAAQNADENRVSMVKQLAQKLGIEEHKVQSAMDAIHTERQGAMQKQMEEKLNQAVKDGKLTEAQKKLMIQKHAEIKAERESHRETMKNMTPEQRKIEMEKHQAELQTWAQDNGIDMSLFTGDMGKKGGMRGFGHMK